MRQLHNQSILLFCKLNFGHGLSLLLKLLSLFKIPFSHLLQVFLKKDLSFLTIFGFLSLLKNVPNVVLKLFWVSYVNQLQRIFDSNFPPAGNIIHQELDQIEEVPRLEPGFIKDASFIHECELVLIYAAIEVLIDLPQPLVNFGFIIREVQLGQDPDDVFLVELVLGSKLVRLNNYGFLFVGYYLSILKLPLVAYSLSPQILLNVFFNLYASMF